MRRPLRLATGLLGAGLVLTLSCAQVIGAGDYHVTSGSGDDGGSTCSPTALDVNALQPAITACVWLTGCLPFKPTAGTISMSTCVNYNYPAAEPIQSCATTAKSCADMVACSHVAYATPSDCPSAGAFCNGTTAANCSAAGQGYIRRCDLDQGTCKTYQSGGKTIANCDVLPSCSNTDTNLHCNQNTLYFCAGGAGYGEKCPSNSTCKETSNGADCYSNSLTSCSLTGDHCDGDVYVQCLPASLEHKFDCGALGLSCQEVTDEAGKTNPNCLAPGCTVQDQTNCQESCSGTIANICVGGAQLGIACTDFGMQSCQTYQVTDSSGNTQPQVYCRPY